MEGEIHSSEMRQGKNTYTPHHLYAF